MKSSDQTFYYKHNRLQQLRGFCFAAQYGSISRAAQFMGLTHSSVSLQIKALEDDMGCQLFQRNGPKITLTPEGATLLEMAMPLVDGIHSLHTQFHHEVKARTSTELRIAVNNTAKQYLMPAIARDYLERNPDIRIVVHFAEHAKAIEMIRADEIDLAILPRREQSPFPKYCHYTPVFHCKPCLITLPDHPLAGRRKLTVADIKRYPITLPAEELQVIPGLHSTFKVSKADPAVRISFVNTETGREQVEAGLVITISSDIWMRENDVLVATPLSHLFPDIDYGIVHKAGKVAPKKVQHFIEISQQHARKRIQARKS